MNPRIMDAVGFIGQFVSEHLEGALYQQDDLKDLLMGQGFSEAEISNAFKWIEDHTLGEMNNKHSKNTSAKPKLRPSARPLTSYETSKISSAAYGTVLKLYERGLIEITQLEEILERAMRMPGEEVSARQMKRLAALVLFNQVQAEWRDQPHAKSTLVN